MIVSKTIGWLGASALAATLSGATVLASGPVGDAVREVVAGRSNAASHAVDVSEEDRAAAGLPEQASDRAVAAVTAARAAKADRARAESTSTNQTTQTNNTSTLQSTSTASTQSTETEGDEAKINKVAQAVAKFYDLKPEEVNDLHKAGFGFGQIAKALSQTDGNLEEARALLESGEKFDRDAAKKTTLGAIMSGRASADSDADSDADAAAATADTTEDTDDEAAEVEDHINKVATALAKHYELTPEEVAGLHDDKFGYGRIAKALSQTDGNLEEARALLESGEKLDREASKQTTLGAIMSGRAESRSATADAEASADADADGGKANRGNADKASRGQAPAAQPQQAKNAGRGKNK